MQFIDIYKACELRGFGGRPQEIANLTWLASLLDSRCKSASDELIGAESLLDTRSFTSQELSNTLWAFAALKYQHEPLIEAIASRSRANIPHVPSQNLVNTAWALDVLKWPKFDRQALHAILLRFTSSCASSLGVEFVTLATLVKERGIQGEVPAFMAEFQTRILNPALTSLRAIHNACDDRVLTSEIKRFQDWVVETQTPHLGNSFTVDALVAAGVANFPDASVPERGWAQWAREAVAGVTWWSCPHAAVSSHGVAAWIAAHVRVRDELVEETGRVYFADDSAEHSILVERMLVPVFLQVARNGHAERRALIDLLRAVARAFKYGNAEAWDEVTGNVNLYASHYPCISCLAVIAQFTRRLPQLALQVEFDNAWASWSEKPSLTAAPGALIMGSAA